VFSHSGGSPVVISLLPTRSPTLPSPQSSVGCVWWHQLTSGVPRPAQPFCTSPGSDMWLFGYGGRVLTAVPTLAANRRWWRRTSCGSQRGLSAAFFAPPRWQLGRTPAGARIPRVQDPVRSLAQIRSPAMNGVVVKAPPALLRHSSLPESGSRTTSRPGSNAAM
jgi:hypothetical protein